MNSLLDLCNSCLEIDDVLSKQISDIIKKHIGEKTVVVNPEIKVQNIIRMIEQCDFKKDHVLNIIDYLQTKLHFLDTSNCGLYFLIVIRSKRRVCSNKVSFSCSSWKCSNCGRNYFEKLCGRHKSRRRYFFYCLFFLILWCFSSWKSRTR